MFSVTDENKLDVYYRYGHSTFKEDGEFDIQVDQFPFWGDEREFLMVPHEGDVAVREVHQSGLTFMWFRDEKLDQSDPVNIVLKSQLWLTEKVRQENKDL